ncbi:protein hunchback-like [Odontomachus brunneus]|uniref:protein hunchback-like n=1 Tax=Odontomachus brunneus TaxID=486640 RepID=UPI0013F19757|nr:protein hunchback-like [Odontomachus brunneus]
MVEDSSQFQKSKLQQDIMSENYDPGEGPSNANLQDKCSLCDFATRNRQDIIQHLTKHISSKTSNSVKLINIALNQLRHFHNQEKHSTSSRNDNQDEDKCAAEPRTNTQRKVKTFSCKHCDFKTVTKLEYWSHIRTHIKSSKLMSCYRCPFVTEYKHHLQYHLLNHTGAKPYKCTICGYTCVNKAMLNSHMKSHSSVYQYRCKDCDYVTKYCHTLKQHLRKLNHKPAAILNVDGTLSPAVIDVYGTRRGPKQRPKISDSKTSRSTATATEEPSTSTATQTMASGDESNNSNSNDNVQPSTSTASQMSSQALSSMSSGSASVKVPSFTSGVTLTKMFRRGNNLMKQKDEQTNQEMPHFSFQRYLFTLNMETQLLPSSSSGCNETSKIAAPSDKAELQSSEGAEKKMTTPATSTAKVDKYKSLEGSTIEITPLDLRINPSLRKEFDASKLTHHQSSLNMMNLPKVAGTVRRRKGVVTKHRIVGKEEDTDEETMQNEKRLCQSASPQATSIPSTSFVAAPTPSTSVIAASTAPSSSPGKDSAGDSACPGQKYEGTSTQSESPSSQDRFVCLHCDIPFPDQTVYIAHARYHSIVEPFTCNMCGTSYGNMQKFNLHIFENKCFKQHKIASISSLHG